MYILTVDQVDYGEYKWPVHVESNLALPIPQATQLLIIGNELSNKFIGHQNIFIRPTSSSCPIPSNLGVNYCYGHVYL